MKNTHGSARVHATEMAITGEFVTLIESFKAHGSNKALTFYKGDNQQQLNYEQLHTATLGWCAFLQNSWNIGPASRVALCSPNSLSFVPIALAVIALGGVLLPFNPESDTAFIKAALHQAPVDAILMVPELDPALLGVFVEFIPQLFFIEGVSAPRTSAAAIFHPQPPDAPALMLFTSGTTGHPKGVLLSQSALLSNAGDMLANFKLHRTTQLAVMPLFHAHAFGFGMMTSLLSGGHLVLMQGLSAALWKRAIQEQRVNFTSVAPPLLQILLRMRVKQAELPSLRAILVSSAPLASDMATSFMQQTGMRLIHGWGLSEYTNFACCLKVDEGGDYYHRCLQEHAWPSVGHALGSTELHIRDTDGVEVGLGTVGELWIRGPSTMLCYFGDEIATADTLRDGWLRSGDLAYAADSEYGRLYFITGRLKEIIIRGGEKIAPMAVELQLRPVLSTLGPGSWAIVGYPHSIYGEEIGLYIHGSLDMDAAALAAMLEYLPNNIRPKLVVCGADRIPMTHTGKVQRLKLQVHFRDYAKYSGPLLIVHPLSTMDEGTACQAI